MEPLGKTEGTPAQIILQAFSNSLDLAVGHRFSCLLEKHMCIYIHIYMYIQNIEYPDTYMLSVQIHTDRKPNKGTHVHAC